MINNVVKSGLGSALLFEKLAMQRSGWWWVVVVAVAVVDGCGLWMVVDGGDDADVSCP